MLWMTAWRNLWRNKRRTIIIISAIVVGLLGVLSYISFVNAWWRQTVENAVMITDGYVQVQAPGYYENPQIKFSLPEHPEWHAAFGKLPLVTGAGPRIKAFVLASNSEKSEMAQMVGTVPADERRISMIPGTVREGRWLEDGDENGVVIGAEMARRFKTKLDRRIIIRGTTADGEIVDSVFRVVGIFETGLLDFDRGTIYVTLSAAQRTLDMTGRVTEWVLAAAHPGEEAAIKAAALPVVPAGEGVVTTWQEQQPLVVKMIDMSRSLMWFFNLFFFVAMAFGVANTLLMSVVERTREIGVMLALGVARRTVIGVIVLEALMLAAIACVVGNAKGIAIVHHYGAHGVDLRGYIEGMSFAGMRGVLNPYLSVADIVSATLSTAAVAVFVAIYPAWKASRLQPVRALRDM